MVAYNFQEYFLGSILTRRKCWTIRAVGKRRHARAGEALQLYTAMRTKQCRKLGDAECWRTDPITLHLRKRVVLIHKPEGRVHIHSTKPTDDFAKQDGFTSWDDLVAFWAVHHPKVTTFEGLLIRWRPDSFVSIDEGPRPGQMP